MKERTRIVIVGVGGQGIIRAARILADAAIRSDLPVVMNEVHGMSQRGGIVETSLVLGRSASALIGRDGADILIAFEPLEAIRAMHVVCRETMVVINSRPIIPPGVHLFGTDYIDLNSRIEDIDRRCGGLVVLDGFEIAEKAGSTKATNVVILGALAQTRVLPFEPDTLLESVLSSVGERFVEINKKAFAMGREAASSCDGV